MPVQQGRLAGVRRTRNRHHQTIAQSLAPAGAGQRLARSRRAIAAQQCQRRRDQILRHIGLVGKIDPRLDQRQRLDQPLAPGLGLVAEQALHLAKRLAALRLRLRADQVGEAFDRGQVELAVLERAAGELAGLGRAQPIDSGRAPRARAAITARPPCNCSSAMSSPVSLFGPGNHSASASSMISPRRGSRSRASAAWRGAGMRPTSALQRVAARAGRRCAPPRSPPAAGRRRGRRWCRWRRSRGGLKLIPYPR